MLKLVVPGQGIKPTLILPLTTAMPSQHATFQQLWKKTQNIQKLFPSNFFLKKQTVECQKKFRKWSNFAIFFSFLGLLSAQPVCLFCFPAYLQSCNSSIKQAHVWIWDTQKRQNWKYRTPILRCSSYKRKSLSSPLFLRPPGSMLRKSFQYNSRIQISNMFRIDFKQWRWSLWKRSCLMTYRKWVQFLLLLQIHFLLEPTIPIFSVKTHNIT